MKRSRQVALVLMGSSPLLFTACASDTTEEGLYTSVAACTAQTGDAASCQSAYDQTQREMAQSGPRYASRADCVAVHGDDQCQAVRQQQGHSLFMPLVAGYLMGRMLSGSQVSGLRGTPAFRDRQGGWQRPGAGTGVYRAGSLSRPALAPLSMQPDQRPTVRRGGFGTQDRRRSSGS